MTHYLSQPTVVSPSSASLEDREMFQRHVRALEEKILIDSTEHSKLVQMHANCQTTILTMKNQLKSLLENKVSLIKQLQESERMRLALVQQRRSSFRSNDPLSHRVSEENKELHSKIEELSSKLATIEEESKRELSSLHQENSQLKRKIKLLETQSAQDREKIIDLEREKKTVAHELLIAQYVSNSKNPDQSSNNTDKTPEEDVLGTLEKELAKFRTRTFMAEASLEKLENVVHDNVTKYERKIRALKRKLNHNMTTMTT